MKRNGKLYVVMLECTIASLNSVKKALGIISSNIVVGGDRIYFIINDNSAEQSDATLYRATMLELYAKIVSGPKERVTVRNDRQYFGGLGEGLLSETENKVDKWLFKPLKLKDQEAFILMAKIISCIAKNKQYKEIEFYLTEFSGSEKVFELFMNHLEDSLDKLTKRGEIPKIRVSLVNKIPEPPS
jgi:hypothetical protein